VTLSEAQKHLDAWLAADLALATSKEYVILGNHRLTRADAAEVKERIQYWSRVVSSLKGTARRCRRVVPID
jgi:hypothetical protein